MSAMVIKSLTQLYLLIHILQRQSVHKGPKFVRCVVVYSVCHSDKSIVLTLLNYLDRISYDVFMKFGCRSIFWEHTSANEHDSWILLT